MMERTDDDENREALDLLMRGFQISRMIRLVADLEIADKIGEMGDRDLNELATACAVQSVPLLRVLRTLAAFGIFRVSVDGRISHSPRSLLLRTDVPNSMHHGARFWTEPFACYPTRSLLPPAPTLPMPLSAKRFSIKNASPFPAARQSSVRSARMSMATPIRVRLTYSSIRADIGGSRQN